MGQFIIELDPYQQGRKTDDLVLCTAQEATIDHEHSCRNNDPDGLATMGEFSNAIVFGEGSVRDSLSHNRGG